MADVDTAPSTAPTTSSSTFTLSAYKDTATTLLTFIVPPAAIAVRQGKVDLESRHLALSLALYLSVICYLPAVVHAYWLLYVRDNGGVEEWAGARVRQAKGLWNDHGGIVKTKVDQYSPWVIGKYESVRGYATDKLKYVVAKKDELWGYVTAAVTAVRELFEDAREAYASGTFIDWAKEKIRAAVEKVKTLLESYPRLLAIVHYVEQRVPLVLEFLGKIYEAIRSKLQPAGSGEEETEEPGRDDSTSTCGDILAGIPRPPAEAPVEASIEAANDDHEGTDNTVQSPTSSRTTEEYETAEDHDTTVDSLNEGRTEEEISQEL
ncbi:hypothetical protein PMAYCL1PPCAC_16592 [Pristionchus mayeri]|uniref:Uncharacterized protein n=1 Tax=Pristionchus mayeri TaxID=1317129 RepID=A0AAN5CL08_9BILA|nr:hypothetical protein PMAYCL1PPCAC_16592 [Pristionchus mayeri]